MKPACLGVFREITNSPNHETNDEMILRAVGAELEKLGAKVSLIKPETMADVNIEDWDIVFPMCENPPALKCLRAWQANGKKLVNPVDAILNCYRVNMTPLMAACSAHPRTEMMALDNLPQTPPYFMDSVGVWIKRGDVHNTCDHDVVRVMHWEKDMPAVKTDFETRGIKDICVQEHIEGDLIKFYAVGPLKWFGWFYHKGDGANKYPFNVKDVENSAGIIAKKLKLEVFGGDAIITPDGKIYIIDMNSWPSFARVREDVKKPIAEHILEKALLPN